MENSKEDDCISQQELNKGSQAKPGLFLLFPVLFGYTCAEFVLGFVVVVSGFF